MLQHGTPNGSPLAVRLVRLTTRFDLSVMLHLRDVREARPVSTPRRGHFGRLEAEQSEFEKIVPAMPTCNERGSVSSSVRHADGAHQSDSSTALGLLRRRREGDRDGFTSRLPPAART
jgi:hypothetical protein